jgi:hypothetical protein
MPTTSDGSFTALHAANETITLSRNSFDIARGAGVIVEGAAEFGDASVHRPCPDRIIPAPDDIQQPFAADEFVRVRHQIFKQKNRFGGERDFFVLQIDTAGAAVEPERAAIEGLGGGKGRLTGAGAAQDGADAGNEFVRVEGLVEVVVCAFFEGHRALKRFPDLG